MPDQKNYLKRAMVALSDAQSALIAAHAADPDDKELEGLRDVVTGAVRLERDADRSPVDFEGH